MSAHPPTATDKLPSHPAATATSGTRAKPSTLAPQTNSKSEASPKVVKPTKSIIEAAIDITNKTGKKSSGPSKPSPADSIPNVNRNSAPTVQVVSNPNIEFYTNQMFSNKDQGPESMETKCLLPETELEGSPDQ